MEYTKTPWDILIELPAEIQIIGGHSGHFDLSHEKHIGWMATYMYYEFDILDLDYSESAEEAIRVLSAWLEENKDQWIELSET